MAEGGMTVGSVVAAIRDLFFAAKVRAAAGALNVPVTMVESLDALQAAAPGARLILLDLADEAFAPLATIRYLKDLPSPPTVVGFLGHEQVELARAAHEAGCDLILNRRQFSARLAELLGDSPIRESRTGLGP